MAMRGGDVSQVTDLLERMTPASARFDLQTSAFTDLVEQQNVLSQPGAYCGLEPWCGIFMAYSYLKSLFVCMPDVLAFLGFPGFNIFVQHYLLAFMQYITRFGAMTGLRSRMWQSQCLQNSSSLGKNHWRLQCRAYPSLHPTITSQQTSRCAPALLMETRAALRQRRLNLLQRRF